MRQALRAVFALLSSLAVVTGCGSDSALLIIEVTGRPPSVQSLHLTVQFNGKQVMPSTDVINSLDNFGLLLPPEPMGPFVLSADGRDSRGCVIAQGHTDTTLTGHDRIRLTMPMTALQLPVCPR